MNCKITRMATPKPPVDVDGMRLALNELHGSSDLDDALIDEGVDFIEDLSAKQVFNVYRKMFGGTPEPLVKSSARPLKIETPAEVVAAIAETPNKPSTVKRFGEIDPELQEYLLDISEWNIDEWARNIISEVSGGVYDDNLQQLNTAVQKRATKSGMLFDEEDVLTGRKLGKKVSEHPSGVKIGKLYRIEGLSGPSGAQIWRVMGFGTTGAVRVEGFLDPGHASLAPTNIVGKSKVIQSATAGKMVEVVVNECNGPARNGKKKCSHGFDGSDDMRITLDAARAAVAPDEANYCPYDRERLVEQDKQDRLAAREQQRADKVAELMEKKKAGAPASPKAIRKPVVSVAAESNGSSASIAPRPRTLFKKMIQRGS